MFCCSSSQNSKKSTDTVERINTVSPPMAPLEYKRRPAIFVSASSSSVQLPLPGGVSDTSPKAKLHAKTSSPAMVATTPALEPSKVDLKPIPPRAMTSAPIKPKPLDLKPLRECTSALVPIPENKKSTPTSTTEKIANKPTFSFYTSRNSPSAKSDSSAKQPTSLRLFVSRKSSVHSQHEGPTVESGRNLTARKQSTAR